MRADPHYHDEDGGPVWPMLLVVGALIGAVLLTAMRGCALAAVLLLCACSRPAFLSDVEKVRDDNISAARAQRDAFKDWLADHPGDYAGASARAFGANVKVQETKREEAKEQTPLAAGVQAVVDTFLGMKPSTAITVASVVGTTLLGILGTWLDKRSKRRAEDEAEAAVASHDDAPFEGPNGEKVPEPRIAAATLWVEAEQKRRVAVPAGA